MLDSTPDSGGSPPESRPTRQVLIVDDHDAMRHALSELIDAQSDLAVCAAMATAEEAVQALETCRPDVAVVDVSLPGMNGIELTQLLRLRLPGLPVVVISSHPAARFEQPALDAGAHAYVAKREAAGHLVSTLRRSLRNGAPG